MSTRKLQLTVLFYIFVLAACQSMETLPVAECVAGFVKTKSGCRSVKSLSSEELYEADARLSSQIASSEAELATHLETKKMIEKMKETEAANRRMQMAEINAARAGNTTATGANYSRSQVPVGFLGERTSAPLPSFTEKAALRSELKGSFANEFRGKTIRGGTSNDGAQ